MEQKYNTSTLGQEMERLREFFEQEGEIVTFNKGELLECEGEPAQSTIEAMMPSRVLRVSGEQLERFFCQSLETMKMRAIISEHILCQFHKRYLDLHCTTPRERYDLLIQRCPGIVNELPLNAIASFLNITPKTMSMLRRDITYGKK